MNESAIEPMETITDNLNLLSGHALVSGHHLTKEYSVEVQSQLL